VSLKDKNEILKMSDMSLWAAAMRECDMVTAQHVPPTSALLW
jgi:hypothetical protein